MRVFDVKEGSSPIILGLPHTGTDVPADIWQGLNDNGKILADTDWHIHELYAGLLENATTVRATFHRYVIDANRDPAGVSLYPGQNTTGLVPETDFDGEPIWNEGQEPAADDIAYRLENFHAPYHAALAAEIERVKSIHGIAILYDCHSIRSHIPLPVRRQAAGFQHRHGYGQDLRSGHRKIAVEVTAAAEGYDSILNGRFKGGWTTRHYGKPQSGVHAIQMEPGAIHPSSKRNVAFCL